MNLLQIVGVWDTCTAEQLAESKRLEAIAWVVGNFLTVISIWFIYKIYRSKLRKLYKWLLSLLIIALLFVSYAALFFMQAAPILMCTS